MFGFDKLSFYQKLSFWIGMVLIPVILFVIDIILSGNKEYTTQKNENNNGVFMAGDYNNININNINNNNDKFLNNTSTLPISVYSLIEDINKHTILNRREITESYIDLNVVNAEGYIVDKEYRSDSNYYIVTIHKNEVDGSNLIHSALDEFSVKCVFDNNWYKLINVINLNTKVKFSGKIIGLREYHGLLIGNTTLLTLDSCSIEIIK